MKTYLRILLLLLLSIVADVASAYQTYYIDGVFYNFINDEAAVTYKPKNGIAGHLPYHDAVVIPESVTYNGKTYSVTSIGERAFYGCSRLTSITIPNSVTSIGENAFRECYNLISVTLNSNTIVSENRDSNSSMKTIFGEQVAEYVIGNSVKSIGYYAFFDCSVLTSITIGSNVTSIERYAFFRCSGLTSVTISNSVTTIGDYAFSGCSGLTSVTIPNSLWRIGKQAFCACSGLTSVTIPNSVTTIGSEAFYGCSGLTSITIPNSVTTIGSEAFSGCSGLTSITISNNVTIIDEDTFRSCSSLTYVTIPESVTSIGDNAFLGCTSLNAITFSDSLRKIGNNTFCNCSSLTSLTIPNSMTSIGSGAFFDCTSLTSVTIPNSVTSIGAGAFYGTTWFNNQPDGLVYAGKVAYKYKGTMPEGTQITIKEGTFGISAHAFYGCKGLTSITIPNSVTSIGNSAFCQCSGLTSITIPNSVTSIGNNAFSGCSGLTSVAIPNSVTNIGSWAFSYCGGLTSVTIGNSVTSIGRDAFWGCNNISYLKMHCPVVGSWFNGKSCIKTLIIGDEVSSIGNWAFEGCSGLKDVYCYAEKVPNASTNAFYESSIASATLHVPTGSENLYKSTSPWKNFGKIIPIEEGLVFADTNVKALCIANWDTNGDGELSEDEAAKVRSIGNVFKGNTNITSFDELQYFTGLTEITNYAFENCTGLTSIVIPYGVTSIGSCAFKGCNSLTSVSIPNSVTRIVGYAFAGCSSLTSIDIPESVTSISYSVFYGCSSLTSVTIPNGVTNIGSHTFSGCSSLTTITIPNSVTNIDYCAFYGCRSLKDVYCYAENVPETSSSAFDGSNITSATLYVPKGSKESYKFTFPWSMFGKIKSENVYELIYMVDGEVYKTYDIESGSSITPEPAPTKEGYTFSGWSGLPTTMPAHDVTVTGSFIVNNYTLTYKVDGDIYKTYTIAYGTVLTPEPAPTKEGYTFSGWDGLPTTMPAYDVTVTGSFIFASTPVNIFISNTGYATFYDSRYAYVLPNNLSAQVVTNASNGKLTYRTIADGNASGIVPKGTAVMLASDGKASGTYTLTASQSTITYNGTNLLHGSDIVTMTTGSGYHYKLSYGQTGTAWNDVFGWYWGAQDGAPFPIEEHKAWLVVPSGGTRAEGFTIDGDATEIIGIESDGEGLDVYYDIQGRCISTPTSSGIYIKNGKKVVIK